MPVKDTNDDDHSGASVIVHRNVDVLPFVRRTIQGPRESIFTTVWSHAPGKGQLWNGSGRVGKAFEQQILGLLEGLKGRRLKRKSSQFIDKENALINLRLA
jgi:hypothetical protein